MFPWFWPLGCLYVELNGLFYTSIFFIEMNVEVPRPSCDGLWVATTCNLGTRGFLVAGPM